MTGSPEAVVIGAGPYGLSAAAYLRARGISFRIFGKPMQSWRERMPAGMLLKSEGFATDLFDPERRFTLKRFCAGHGIPYGDTGVPVALETMSAYGLSFQKQLVPGLEEKMAVAINRAPEGFLIRLDDGELVTTKNVIVAVGSGYFAFVPPGLAHLPPEFLTHSSAHHDLDRFKGSDVTILGGGASALDLAALLDETGARVRLVIRKPHVKFISKPGKRTLWSRIRYPLSGIGIGWRSYFYTQAPMLFRYLPRKSRVKILNTHLGPAGGWTIKERILGRVPVLPERIARDAEIRDGRVLLRLVNPAGGEEELSTGHIIAATGYRLDVNRLDFLSKDIRSSLQLIENAPALSPDFQSSIQGLYFIGVISGYDFGPSMRFVVGAGYTAKRLARHLAGKLRGEKLRALHSRDGKLGARTLRP